MKRQFLVPKSCLEEVTMMSRRLALFFSSLLLRLLLSDGCFCVVLFLFTLLLFLLFFSKEERERERNTRAKKSMHVNLEHKNEETSVCFRSSVEMISFVVSYSCGAFLLRERKTNQRTRKRRRWRSSYVCIYIYNARKWIALLCIVRACVVIFFFVKERWWSDGTTRKSDVFVLSAPKKKERSLKTKRDEKKVPCGKKVQPL